MNCRLICAWTIVVLCGCGGCLYGQPAAKKEAGHRHKADAEAWTVEDILAAEHADDFHISPDGRWVVWVKHAPDKDKDVVVTHLMLSGLAEEREIQLTRGSHSCASPRWSPDGKLLAFLSSRPAPKEKAARRDDEKEEPKEQIWLINPFGGEPWVLTEAARDIHAFAWQDAETLLYLAQEKMTLREQQLKDKKDTTEVVEDEATEPPVRLWRVTVESKETERLTDNKDRLHDLAVAPDGRHAVLIHERSLSYTFDQRVPPAVFLYDLQTLARRQLFAWPHRHVSHIRWQSDSKGFYAISPYTRHPLYLMAYVNELYHCDLAGAATRVELDWPRGLVDGEGSFTVTPDGFLALLADGVQQRAARYTRQGHSWKREMLPREHVQALVASKDGKILVLQESSCQQPPRWLRGKLDGNRLQGAAVLTDLEADLRKKARARVETIHWPGARGDNVEGLLYYPHTWKHGQKYPLVVLIHGGPFAADVDAWEEDWAHLPNLLCARDAFVFCPNYHGSSHYGLDWAESIAGGKYYELPVADIEHGIDHLVQRGLVDAGKVGLSGWSNGAILTMALITRRHYRAASAGAGGSEWVGDWGTCEFGLSFSNYYLGKSPLEDPELYRRNAPFFDFPKVRTPTLLFQGSDDRVVPAHHGWMQFRALQQLGKTEVRFVLFPGEKHGLKKLAHRRRKVEEELAWFDRHLFGTTKKENPSLKDDSPLAIALARREAARIGLRFGVVRGGVLVPETITYQGHQLGRFEVTRAQYAEFDKTYSYEPGTDNYPASGITYAQARAYCAWLSRVTGAKYRLGRVDELAELYEDLTGSENTLDTWAGYSVNPEDRAHLQEKIRQLGGPAPLLKEVGSARSGGDIFDLGGSVAEWAEDASGRGRPLGGSADRSADDRRAPAPEYIGLRVLRDVGR